MRLSYYLTVTVMFMCLFAIPAVAQRGKESSMDQAKQQRIYESQQARKMAEGMKKSEQALEALEDFYRPRTSADVLRERKMEIARNLKQLNEMSEALISNLNLPPSSDCKELKEAADLANKIAKTSKRLRKDLDLDSDKEKLQSVSLPAETERITQLRQMAEEIDRMVKEVQKAQSDNSVDASLVQQTGDNLQSIEVQANNVKALARTNKK